MNTIGLLQTALLLGLFASLAGCYGTLYTIGRLRGGRQLRYATMLVYGLLGFTTVVIVARTPLAAGWKALVAASSLVVLVIPPMTWRYLQRTHENEGLPGDRKSDNGLAGPLARL